MKNLFIVLLLLTSFHSWSACRQAVKLFGSFDLQTKKWKLITSAPASQTICIDTNAANANLELEFVKGKERLTQKLYSALSGFYDYNDKDGRLNGGETELRSVFIETWAPQWYKGAQMKITEMESGKALVETKL